MRLYTFINFYLSQIQQGIQTAHLTHELFNKYAYSSSTEILQLTQWSQNHKTIIVLNAGADPQIQELMDIFAKYQFPFADFREDEGLCFARTGCGIVLPDWIYGCEREFDKETRKHYYVYHDEYIHVVEGDDSGNEVDTGPLVREFREGDKYFDLIDAIKSKRLA